MSGGFASPPSGAPQFQAPGPSGPPVGPLTVAPSPVRPAPLHPDPAPTPPTSYGPPPGWAVVPVPTGPPQRPAVIALGCTLAVMGSLQWICGLTLFWVAATITVDAFAEVDDTGALFHGLSRFTYRMLDGLAFPLYLLPLASMVTGFLVLSRRSWTRAVHTAVGLVALAWSAWWLQDNLLWWVGPAWYVLVACLVLWTPAATAWYRWPRAAERLQPPG